MALKIRQNAFPVGAPSRITMGSLRRPQTYILLGDTPPVPHPTRCLDLKGAIAPPILILSLVALLTNAKDNVRLIACKGFDEFISCDIEHIVAKVQSVWCTQSVIPRRHDPASHRQSV